MMTCFHSNRNIPTIINLIEASRGTDKTQGLSVYAMHLMELTERSSAIRMVHKVRDNGLPFFNKGQQQDSSSDQVVVAFEAYGQLSHVQIKPMTAIAHFSNMHEDICALAEDKRAAIIILPFHKHQKVDGSFETTRHGFRQLNKRVFKHAPCSVGVLVDRGLGGSAHVAASSVSSVVTVVFFGGPDDQEALAFGLRMADHPGITVNVVRVMWDPSVSETDQGTVAVDIGGGKSTDEEVLAELNHRLSTRSSTPIKYEERVVRSGSETVSIVKEYSKCNLFLVGRSPEGKVAANLGSVVSRECPELGPVGSLLISQEASTNASVLVIQQYNGGSRPAAFLEEGSPDESSNETD